MNTVPYIRRYAEQWWDWKEVQEYAKDKDMEWSEQQCKDFLEEHEEEISTALREVGDDLVDQVLGRCVGYTRHRRAHVHHVTVLYNTQFEIVEEYQLHISSFLIYFLA